MAEVSAEIVEDTDILAEEHVGLDLDTEGRL